MTDRGENQTRNDSTEAISDGIVTEDGRWISFYRCVYHSMRYEKLLFAALAIAGVFTITLSITALLAESGAVSPSSAVVALGGGVALTVGIGYFVIRHNTTCSECGTEFSRTLTGKRVPVEQSEGQTRTIQQIECQNCGQVASYTCATKDQESHRW